MVGFRNILLAFTATSLLVVLVVSLWNRLRTYRRHDIGVTVTMEENYGDIPFPAVSVCLSHYDFPRLKDDLGFPRNPFTQRASPWMNDPTMAYDKLEYGVTPINVTDFLHTYYVMVDELFIKSSYLYQGCKVGGSLCDVKKGSAPPWPNQQDATVEVEVQAGKWKSRIMADSEKGYNVMCHTLIPNVSVDFTMPTGNSVTLKWVDSLLVNVPQWNVYVHDRNEHVLLAAYAMADLPRLTLRRPVEGNYLLPKGKAKLLPKLILKPDTSNHPCVSGASYSQNLCYLKKFWRSRVDAIRDHYGNRFNCIIPGILLDGEELPLCTKDVAVLSVVEANDTLGYLDLIAMDGMSGVIKMESEIPNLVSPPIGVERSKIGRCPDPDGDGCDESDACLPRCSRYEYDVDVKTVNEADEDVGNNDVHIYFATRNVQVWKEFEQYNMMSFLSDIGGLMGLLLGLSLFSVVEKSTRLTEIIWRKQKKNHGRV